MRGKNLKILDPASPILNLPETLRRSFENPEKTAYSPAEPVEVWRETIKEMVALWETHGYMLPVPQEKTTIEEKIAYLYALKEAILKICAPEEVPTVARASAFGTREILASRGREKHQLFHKIA